MKRGPIPRERIEGTGCDEVGESSRELLRSSLVYNLIGDEVVEQPLLAEGGGKHRIQCLRFALLVLRHKEADAIEEEQKRLDPVAVMPEMARVVESNITDFLALRLLPIRLTPALTGCGERMRASGPVERAVRQRRHSSPTSM